MITLTQKSVSASRGVGNFMAGEKYDALVQWIRAADDRASDEATMIGVTRCNYGAGASTVAASLAATAARHCERPVLLLDLSSTRPLFATQLAIADDLGLRKALASDSNPGRFATASGIPNLSLLGANEVGAPRTPSTDGRKLNEMLRELKRDFEFIVVDLPPADSCIWLAISGMLSGVLLVVEAERTGGAVAARAVQRLTFANANVLGVILNKYSLDALK